MRTRPSPSWAATARKPRSSTYEWDYGDRSSAYESSDEPAAGGADSTYEDDDYILTYNTGLGYIGLERIDNEEAYMDVRLQVHQGGGWSIHTGDASYDQDHRGYWGASSLSRDTDCAELAEELIEQAKDMHAQSR
jgi:hypothetical protein